jgi:hypothetical protein
VQRQAANPLPHRFSYLSLVVPSKCFWRTMRGGHVLSPQTFARLALPHARNSAQIRQTLIQNWIIIADVERAYCMFGRRKSSFRRVEVVASSLAHYACGKTRCKVSKAEEKRGKSNRNQREVGLPAASGIAVVEAIPSSLLHLSLISLFTTLAKAIVPSSSRP